MRMIDRMNWRGGKQKGRKRRLFRSQSDYVMIKIKNSFLAFSSEYNTQRKSKEEGIPNLRGDAKDMDRFLRTSSFTNRRDQTPPININIQAKSAIKQSYYFKEDRPRFKYDGNRNQLLFG